MGNAAWFGIGASLVGFAAQWTYYICLRRTAQQLVVAFAEATDPSNNPDADDPFPPPTIPSQIVALEFGLAGCAPGLILGQLLTCPVANSFGRRGGLLWSNVFLLLALPCQWVGFLHNFPMLLFPAGLCYGTQFALQTALYYLYIYEACPRAWRAFAIVSIFLVATLLVSVALVTDPIPLDYFGASLEEEEEEGAWPLLLTFGGLIPAAVIQTGALLLCSVESPGWTAIQGGSPAGGIAAEADAKRLSLSASDMEDLTREVGDIESAKKRLAVGGAVICLLIIAINGPFHAERFLFETLDQSDAFDEWASRISLYLTLLFILLAGVTSLWFRSRLSAKRLFSAYLVGLIVSALVRLLVLLVPIVVVTFATSSHDDSNALDYMWGMAAWTVYLIDECATPLSWFLGNALLILLMQVGGQRSRAEMISRPFLIADVICLIGGAIVNAVTGWAAGDGGGGGGGTAHLALTVWWWWLAPRLVLNVLLSFVAWHLWGLLVGDDGDGDGGVVIVRDPEEIGGEESGVGEEEEAEVPV